MTVAAATYKALGAYRLAVRFRDTDSLTLGVFSDMGIASP